MAEENIEIKKISHAEDGWDIIELADGGVLKFRHDVYAVIKSGTDTQGKPLYGVKNTTSAAVIKYPS